ERGTREYNMALGERRAADVQRYLVLQGVSPAQLELVTYGEEKPAVVGSTEEAWAQNRRVELRKYAVRGHMKGYQGFTLGCLLLPVAALAQVPVMEGSGNTGYYPQQQAPRLPDTRSASAGLSAEGQLLLQLDQMQQEVSMLRGL